jgi:hypothetical protein
MLLSVALFQGFLGRSASFWPSNLLSFPIHLALFSGNPEPHPAALGAIAEGKCSPLRMSL